MSSEFYVGQEVVCVRDGWTPPGGLTSEPIKNRHYTIRDIIFDGGEILLLHECVNPIQSCITESGTIVVAEPAFCATGFRPINPDSIAIFREMCVPKGKKILVNGGIERSE